MANGQQIVYDESGTMRLILLFLFGLLSSVQAEKVFLSYAKFPAAKEDRWLYAEALVALHEKSLFDYPDDVDVYRFYDCYTFGTNDVARIIKKGSQITFTGIELGGEGGYYPIGIASLNTQTISPKEWAQYEMLFEKANFWQMSHYINRSILDGFGYILEAKVGGHYYYVVRDEPSAYPEDRRFYELGAWFSEHIQRKHFNFPETRDGPVATGKGVPLIMAENGAKK